MICVCVCINFMYVSVPAICMCPSFVSFCPLLVRVSIVCLFVGCVHDVCVWFFHHRFHFPAYGNSREVFTLSDLLD